MVAHQVPQVLIAYAPMEGSAPRRAAAFAHIYQLCKVFLRCGLICVSVIYCLSRRSSNGSRVRRYDILSAKQLSSDQAASEDTDDELFGPVRSDDANRLLVPESTPR